MGTTVLMQGSDNLDISDKPVEWVICKRTFYPLSKNQNVQSIHIPLRKPAPRKPPIKTWVACCPYITISQCQLNLCSGKNSAWHAFNSYFFMDHDLSTIGVSKGRGFLYSTTGGVSFTPKVNLSLRTFLGKF